MVIKYFPKDLLSTQLRPDLAVSYPEMGVQVLLWTFFQFYSSSFEKLAQGRTRTPNQKIKSPPLYRIKLPEHKRNIGLGVTIEPNQNGPTNFKKIFIFEYCDEKNVLYLRSENLIK